MTRQRKRYTYTLTTGERPTDFRRGNLSKATVLKHAAIQASLGRQATVWRRDASLASPEDWEYYKAYEAQKSAR